MFSKIVCFLSGILVAVVISSLMTCSSPMPINLLDSMDSGIRPFYKLTFPWLEASSVSRFDDFIVAVPYGEDVSEIVFISKDNPYPHIVVYLDDNSRKVSDILVSDSSLNSLFVSDSSLDGSFDNFTISLSSADPYIKYIDQDFDGSFDVRYGNGENVFFEINYDGLWRRVVNMNSKKYIKVDNSLIEIELTDRGYKLH